MPPSEEFPFSIFTTPVKVPTDWVTINEISSDHKLWTIQSVISGLQKHPIHELAIIPGRLQEYGRMRGFPKVTTPPFLDFPIHKFETSPGVVRMPNALNAPVTAPLDHHRTLEQWEVAIPPYPKDRGVGTYRGNVYFVQDDALSLPGEAPRDYAALPASATTLFPHGVDFLYVGVMSQGETRNLQYDGHPGYDYRIPAGTDVYPAADGVTLGASPSPDTSCNAIALKGKELADFYMAHFHAVIVYHPTLGYCTVYMHLSDIAEDYVHKSDSGDWMPKAGEARTTKPIGKVGKFGTRCSDNGDLRLTPHFHFEVWRLDNQGGREIWRYADPYGKYATNGQIIHPALWK